MGMVDEYIQEHKRIKALARDDVNSNEGMVQHIFLKNLSYHVRKYIQDEDCPTLEDTYCEARNAEKKILTSCNLLGTKKEFKGKEFNNKWKGGFQKDPAPSKYQDR